MKDSGSRESGEGRESLDLALRALADGEMLIVYDDDHPESGGFMCTSGRKITPGKVNFMATHARGLVCVALTDARMKQLGIPLMAPESPYGRRHCFGASIEAASGVTTGISAADRARTILVAAAPDARPEDLVMPGHVFPMQVREGGVLQRPGMPEAAADLCRIAGEEPVAALCAILDDEGDIAGIEELRALAGEFSLPLIDVGSVVARRLREDSVVERVAEREIESGYGGSFTAISYRNDFDHNEHLALVAGDISTDAPVTVRVHSQCLTGDVFGSNRCDCGDQLRLAIETISSEGRGVIVYMRQEGRGIGLANKIRAYALQDLGRDTVEANLELGFKEDLRDYGITSQILKELGVSKIRLLTNNPQKVQGLERYGLQVVERRSIETQPHDDNIAYLRTKRSKLGHLLDESSLDTARAGSTDGGERR